MKIYVYFISVTALDIGGNRVFNRGDYFLKEPLTTIKQIVEIEKYLTERFRHMKDIRVLNFIFLREDLYENVHKEKEEESESVSRWFPDMQ